MALTTEAGQPRGPAAGILQAAQRRRWDAFTCVLITPTPRTWRLAGLPLLGENVTLPRLRCCSGPPSHAPPEDAACWGGDQADIGQLRVHLPSLPGSLPCQRKERRGGWRQDSHFTQRHRNAHCDLVLPWLRSHRPPAAATRNIPYIMSSGDHPGQPEAAARDAPPPPSDQLSNQSHATMGGQHASPGRGVGPVTPAWTDEVPGHPEAGRRDSADLKF